MKICRRRTTSTMATLLQLHQAGNGRQTEARQVCQHGAEESIIATQMTCLRCELLHQDGRGDRDYMVRVLCAKFTGWVIETTWAESCVLSS